MPDFVKGLGDVEEGRGAVGFAIEGFEDFVDKAVGLGDGGMLPPEAELVGRDYAIVLD
jgi:hypothetical protein